MQRAGSRFAGALAVRGGAPTRAVLLALAALAVAPAPRAADDAWPSRPIRIIPPTNPGSGTDLVARAFAEALHQKVNQPVVVENKPGGNTIVGAEAFKNVRADGYTFFIGQSASHSANPAVYKKLSYDPTKDFVEVGLFSVYPYVLLVRRDSPYRSLADLIQAAKARPGALSYGHTTPAAQIPAELLKLQAGVEFVGVPYKAAPQVFTDIAGKNVDFTIVNAVTGSLGVATGHLKALAVTSAKALPGFPGAKPFSDTLPGYRYEGWSSLSARAGTPKAILEKMNGYLREALTSPGALRDGIEREGAEVRPTTLAEAAEFVAADQKRWVEWVRIAKIPQQ